MRLSFKQMFSPVLTVWPLLEEVTNFKEFPVPMALDGNWQAGSKQTGFPGPGSESMKGLCLTNKAWKKLLRASWDLHHAQKQRMRRGVDLGPESHREPRFCNQQ